LVLSSLDTSRIIRHRRNGRHRFAGDGEICFRSRQARTRRAADERGLHARSAGIPALRMRARAFSDPGGRELTIPCWRARRARDARMRSARARIQPRERARLSLIETAARRACGRSVSGALVLQPRAGRGDGDHRHAAGSTATRAIGERCRHLADQRARCHAARPLIWRRGNSVPHGALAMGPLP
jgi:hypothetical protein